MTEHVCRVSIYPKKDDFFRIQGSKDAKVQYLTGSQSILGSAEDSDLVLEGAEVGDHHLRITVKDHELYLQNVSQANQTLVSGHAVSVSEPFHYKTGEVIQIGKANVLITLELFSRYLDPDLEADSLVREAQDKAARIAQELTATKIEMKTTVEQAQRESAAALSQARVEADELLAAAQRQIEERSRKAMEENHAKRDEIIKHAETVGANLIASAKNEVDVLLKQSQSKAQVIVKEGEDQRRAALKAVEDLKAEAGKVANEKAALEKETARSKAACEEAAKQKHAALQETRKTEDELSRRRNEFETFRAEVKKAETQWQERLSNFKQEAAHIDEQVRHAQKLKGEAENERQRLQNQSADLQKQIDALTVDREHLTSDIKSAEQAKAKCINEINDLKQTHENELLRLKEKVEAEYHRQVEVHESFFEKLREKEAAAAELRQKTLDRLEAKRLQKRINDVSERLWQTITDRAALYNSPGLKEKVEFKNDLHELTERAMTEEFDLRRREAVTAIAKPESLLRKRKIDYQVRSYTGWILFLGVLGFLLYAQMNPNANERKPASVPAAAAQTDK